MTKQQKREKEATVEELIGRVNSDVREELSKNLKKIVPPRTTTDPFSHSVQAPSTSDRSSVSFQTFKTFESIQSPVQILE